MYPEVISAIIGTEELLQNFGSKVSVFILGGETADVESCTHTLIVDSTVVCE